MLHGSKFKVQRMLHGALRAVVHLARCEAADVGHGQGAAAPSQVCGGVLRDPAAELEGMGLHALVASRQ